MGKPFTKDRISEIDNYVIKNYLSKTTIQLAKDLNCSRRSIDRSKQRLNIVTPKDLKYLNNPSLYKKNNIPVNKKPLLHEFVCEKRGYKMIKFRDGDKNNFKRKSIFIWESHNGPLPKNYVIKHKDGNLLNDSIENLYIVHRADAMKEISFNNYPNELRSICNKLAKIKKLTQ